jgi:uncharacterized metal-binding protein
MLDSTRGADIRIALDGCSTACARKVLEHAGMTVEQAVVVTDLGVKKTHDFVWSNRDISLAMQAAMAGLEQPAVEGECCCGGGCKSC